MISDSESSSDHSDYDDANDENSFENPNYRKLYAALSMTAMMGEQMQDEFGEKLKLQNRDQNHQQKDNKNDENNCSDMLPDGWEKHEDDNGPYYWHIPSGTIQRETPVFSPKKDSLIYFQTDYMNLDKIQTSNQNQEFKSNQFTVHSLGWMDFDEQNLTTQSSSGAIQKCIVELTTRGDAVRCWGQMGTQELVLKIEDSMLKLYDGSLNVVLISQPISGIRIWGVNYNNDFAYVSKDSKITSSSPSNQNSNSNYKCYVFHCEDSEDSAQTIANILKDEMIKIKLANQNSKSPNERPKQLFIYDKDVTSSSSFSTPTAIEFPTPIEEPRKSLVSKYLGRIKVTKPMGIDILNNAIEKIVSNCLDENHIPDDEFVKHNIPVMVHVSPSNIIVEPLQGGDPLVECRVR